MFSLLVFDLDGTLVDSRQDLAEATNRLILECGGQPLDQDAVVHMVGEGVEKLVGRAFRAAGLPVPKGAAARFLELYGDRLLVHTRTYPGVPEALEALAHLTSLAVLTNKPRDLSETILLGLGLESFFGQVLGGDGPHARKPDPEGLQRLMNDFDVDPQDTLLVGDSKIDLQTARAGSVSIALARYGFGFPDLPRDQLKGDELLVDTPGELVTILQDYGPTVARE
jgi:phosphoglycolate phosphatase